MAKVELKGIGKIYDGNVRAVTNANITILLLFILILKTRILHIILR